MKTDEFGCEVAERKATFGNSWKFYFYGTGVGLGLILGFGLSDRGYAPDVQARTAIARIVVDETVPPGWLRPAAATSRATLRTAARLPTLFGVEAEIFERVNATLSAALRS